MKSLFYNTLLWSIVSFACSLVEVLYAEPLLTFSTPDATSNDITLMCIGDPSSCTFNFYRNGTVWWSVEGNRLDFTVTPQTESAIICTCQSGQSNTLMIAALRNSLATTMTVNKFREESEVVILECPVVLGSLYGLLDPYEIVWQDEGKGIDFLDNSYNRSPDNQFLMIPSSISTPREYKCFLRLRRCNNNRCTSIHESAANTLLLNLIGGISLAHSPTAISFSGLTTLNCYATGTDISVAWEYDGFSVPDNYNHRGVRVNTDKVTDVDLDINIINTTLELDAQVFTPSDNMIISCIVSQQLVNTPPCHPANTNKMVHFNLTLNRGGISLVHSPTTLHFSALTTLNCYAIGINISVAWEYNGFIVSDNNYNYRGVRVNTDKVTDVDQNINMINTTLELDTQVFTPSDNMIISCIVSQQLVNTPPGHPANTNKMVHFNLTINHGSIMFQFELSGVSNCGMDPVFNDMNMVEAIVRLVAASCGCLLTASQLTDRVFLCHSSSQSVIYMAQIRPILQAPVLDLITRIQEWAFSGDTNPVQLIIEGTCVSYNLSTVECEVTKPTQMADMTSTGAPSVVIVVVVVVLIVVILIALILITIRVLWSKLWSKPWSKLKPKEESGHEYEDVGMYQHHYDSLLFLTKETEEVSYKPQCPSPIFSTETIEEVAYKPQCPSPISSAEETAEVTYTPRSISPVFLTDETKEDMYIPRCPSPISSAEEREEVANMPRCSSISSHESEEVGNIQTEACPAYAMHGRTPY